jgi:tetratricopeptide (TPR) repeat protein
MSKVEKRRSFLRIYCILLLLVAVAFAAWHFFFRERPDREAAVAANNRGVGEMEQFHYAEAVDAFREAHEKDRKWTVARVNLAIALLNYKEPTHHAEVESLLIDVLKDEENNLHAHYTLGCLYKYHQRFADAYPHFEAVLSKDPNDAHSWLYKGICHPEGEDSPAGIACFRKALELDPYFNVARHKLAGLIRDPVKRKEFQAEFEQLRQAFWEREYKERYYDMGPYAEVIGRSRDDQTRLPAGPIPAFDAWEQFQVVLAPNTKWASPADFGVGPESELQRLVRDRFGATMVLFDYNRDGRPDVFLLGAVVRDGKVGNLLLRNEGDGRFTDVTAETGLAGPSQALGCAVADFDNDDFRDLLLTGIDGVRLMRNLGKGNFVDVTAQAGMDKIGGVCLAAGWVDIDQDSDLDAVICRLADTPAGAIDALNGKPATGGRIEVFLNRGDAEAVPENQRQPPLTVAFVRAEGPKDLLVQGPITGVVLADLDSDKDVDLLVLSDSKAPIAVRNDRLLRFSAIESFPAEAAGWNGGAVLDVNHDGRSDVLLLPNGKAPVLLLSKPGRLEGKADRWFNKGSTNSPPLKQATTVDLDADGWMDAIGVSSDGKLAFLHNDGENRLVHRTDALGLPAIANVIAATAADLDGDCHTDILIWSETEGLKAFRGRENGNKLLKLELTGRYEKDRSRTNADGIGCKVVVQAGSLWTGLENTTLSAGLGQSRLPLTLGVGRASTVDLLRILWPDGTPQAELGLATCEIRTQHEINRKPTSCPVLCVWDGERFRYVTDFLGGGALGESAPDGSVHLPRPEESVKIEPGMMVPKNGKLILKIAEPMDELMYLDRVQLLAIDHPKDAEVHPDERFVIAGLPPTQELLVFKDRIRPTRATNHKGRDVTATLRDRDQKYVTDFARRSWLGYAEEHFVELDFGDRLSKLKPGERTFLVLAGWTDYAYPESICAATQAGVPTIVPTLERFGSDGKWHDLGELGFPAGLPKVMTKEITGLVSGPSCKLRIRTNLQVYWDQIYVAPLAEIASRVTPLAPTEATLAARGFMKEIRRHGPHGPVEYDDNQTEKVEVTPWRGMLTRAGDVTELLLAEDDRFVLCGPGDEVTIAFDAAGLPPLAKDHVRSYVLRTWGYCKDTAPTTVSGGQVEPLPFRGMKAYPHLTLEERRRSDELHGRYRWSWNNRQAAGGPD